jgi:hypothetical protein
MSFIVFGFIEFLIRELASLSEKTALVFEENLNILLSNMSLFVFLKKYFFVFCINIINNSNNIKSYFEIDKVIYIVENEERRLFFHYLHIVTDKGFYFFSVIFAKMLIIYRDS